MSLSAATQFSRWFHYEAAAGRALVDDLWAAGAQLGPTPEFQAIVDLLGHVAAARTVWLWRLGAPGGAAVEVFPKGLTIERVGEAVESMIGPWEAYLAGLDQAELDREFEYASVMGGRWRNSVHDTLIHLHGHSLQHRAQIAMRLRQMGIAPKPVDYIFWARRPV